VLSRGNFIRGQVEKRQVVAGQVVRGQVVGGQVVGGQVAIEPLKTYVVKFIFVVSNRTELHCLPKLTLEQQPK
jgi:hypothetical protein